MDSHGSLATHAEHAGFRRVHELNRFVERAATAERHRDVIFSQLPPASDALLREGAAALEQLDTELAGLCVAHVLACDPPDAPQTSPQSIKGPGTRIPARIAN